MTTHYNIEKIESIKEFGGFLNRYRHWSEVCQCEMHFSLYLPPQIKQQKVSLLYWLSGLTCTDDNFRVKAGAQRFAAKYGNVLVIPDTSPRGENIPDDDHYDLGQGAGFYLNATQEPWQKNYQMYDYICLELPKIIESLKLNVNGKQSIFGHSMGGHGALTIALKNTDKFKSVSAFSPICNPLDCPWGVKAFKHYLGNDSDTYKPYDTYQLIQNDAPQIPMLIDQGDNDEFYPEQLLTKRLEAICMEKSFPVTIHFREGYDHSFHFISTFIEEHFIWHNQYLK